MVQVFVQALYTVLPALIYALSGYMAATPEENFNPALFTKTLLIGVIVGIVQFQVGLTYDQAFQLVSSNAIVMYLLDKLVNALGKLKAKLSYIQENLTPAQTLAIQKAVQLAFYAMFPNGQPPVQPQTSPTT